MTFASDARVAAAVDEYDDLVLDPHGDPWVFYDTDHHEGWDRGAIVECPDCGELVPYEAEGTRCCGRVPPLDDAVRGAEYLSEGTRRLNGWLSGIGEPDTPGEWALVSGSRQAGVDAGLIIWDADRTAHHFRIYEDGRIFCIGCPEDPDHPLIVDPMSDPWNSYTIDTYLTEGPPPAVTDRLEALAVTPTWADACPEGGHTFESDHGRVWCSKCETNRDTLSWLGHAVPRDSEVER
jgi:hypothetical protein